MANKNPYELRTEILHAAKDYMDQQYHMNAEFARKMFDEARISSEQFAEYMKVYSVEDLIAKAREMYEFIADSGKSNK